MEKLRRREGELKEEVELLRGSLNLSPKGTPLYEKSQGFLKEGEDELEALQAEIRAKSR